MIETILTILENFWFSFIVSAFIAGICFYFQKKYYNFTLENLKKYSSFFAKKEKYVTVESSETDEEGNRKKNIKDVAREDAELHGLILDINEYLNFCKGSAAFEIMQNKTERRLTKMYDLVTSKSSFPTHLGLMGTFAGVFLGLSMFLLVNYLSGGVTDGAISSLISGVLVSMSTSFVGLLLSIKANDKICNAKKKIDEDKNDFYEFIQNKLMPSVDISLTEALGNLHHTVATFEPSFSKVIKGFNETFTKCTTAFGEDFRVSVKTMVNAVKDMGKNIETIKSNSELLEELLNRLTNSEWITYMRQFSDATEHFKSVTQSLNDFERARRMMLAATQETINVQKAFNESLQIPRDVAMGINGILQRVVTFEKSINALGETIAQTQMLGNTEIEEIKQQISAIKVKHKVAEQYIETSNNKLEAFFDSQLIELNRLEKKYQDALDNLFSSLEKLMENHKDSINQRHESFKIAIDEKFDLSGVRSELSELKRLPTMDNNITDVKKGQNQLRNINEGIRKEINALNEIKEEEQKNFIERIVGGSSNSARVRENERLEREIKSIKEQAEKDKEELERLKVLGAHERKNELELKERLNLNQRQTMKGTDNPSKKILPENHRPSSVDNEKETEENEEVGFFGKLLGGFGRKKKK